jgi:hypothetical protein
MKIETFIQSEFERRLIKNPCLVIHDQEKRFQPIARTLADSSTKVIDASDSIVLGREEALEAWVGLAEKPGSRLVVYLPWQKPKDDRGRRDNPFAPFALGGSIFPDGDADSYRELCLQCFPTQEEEVNRLFEDGIPSFETVNGLAGGAVWPALRALLGLESEREMILALIAPSVTLRPVLETGGPWLEEARRLIKASLGYDLPGSSWIGMQESLGRFLLFSEFALDLPGDLPASLAEVPCAAEDRRNLVYALCESLRDSLSTRPLYRELAEKVDAILGLSKKFARNDELGKRGTFLFQNKVMLKLCIYYAKLGNFAAASQIYLGEEASVWYDSSATLRSVWACAKAAVKLLDGLQAFSSITDERRTVADFIGAYSSRFSMLDAAYRDLEAFLADREVESDLGDALSELVELARSTYFKSAESLQRKFLDVVEKESWIGPASSDQAASFKTRVAPRMENHEKTAYFMIDALRLDLARELLASLPSTYRSSLDMVRGKLPSITPVGMAALLPNAESNLAVEIEGGSIAPRIGTTRVTNAQERIAYFKATYGDRVRDIVMADLEGLKKTEIGDQVDLLVIRSTEIDAAGESLGAEALPMLSLLLRNLLRAFERTRKLGFPKAIIVTDHGFVLQPPTGAGGAISKPEGVWEVASSRFLLGDGSKTASVKLFEASGAGVPGYSKKLATPIGLGSFVSGTRYVHGGLSLQECVLPVITIDFPSQAPKKRELSVALSYKGGLTKKITTMRPSIDLSVSNPDGTDLFDGEHESDVSIAVLVRSGGKEIGRPQASAGYDPGSGCFKLKPGKAIKITIAMNEDYRGAFTVNALDPITLEQFAKLELETDYTE